ncbi:DUF3231 family protein [Halobacillus naozhouensis]|uniref:DUF3231 family protein n=1 Tax=Halobacillus naozhouensis TaxID=554880 RepID=A0ABY8IYA3_9BACI|nr:DUF3231 family protein [Halobacillus naozhouensis]WFT74337.1 DUF3231 family protein [Halobacillus naozhouensis]
MESTHDHVRLNASELANLWTQYQNDSMSFLVISYFLEKVEDQDVREILEYAGGLSKSHVEKITKFLRQASYPVPKGFSEKDVNREAPPLFSDHLTLYYMYIMTLHGLTGYAAATGTSVRADQRSYFIQCNEEAMKLYDKIVEVMVQKGIFSRPPNLNAPSHIEFVNNQNYLNGWVGKQRPLNAIEIDGLFFNAQKLMVKIVLEVGFSQVTSSKELRKFFQRGEKLCQQQVEILDSILSKENLPAPRKWESEITNSTTAPFSNKLMLFHVVSLVSTAAGFYGAALSVVQRRDLAVQYARLIGQIGLYAEDGCNLLIKNGWLEQPPLTDDRENLARKK